MITQYRIYTTKTKFTAYNTAEFVELAQSAAPSELLKTLYAVSVAKFTDATLTTMVDEKKYIYRNFEEFSVQNFFTATELVRMASFMGDKKIYQFAIQSLREIFLTTGTMDKAALLEANNKGLDILLGMDAQMQGYSGIQNLCFSMCALYFCEEDEPVHVTEKLIKTKITHWKQFEPALCAFFLPIGCILAVKFGGEFAKEALVLMSILEQAEANTVPTTSPDYGEMS